MAEILPGKRRYVCRIVPTVANLRNLPLSKHKSFFVRNYPLDIIASTSPSTTYYLQKVRIHYKTLGGCNVSEASSIKPGKTVDNYCWSRNSNLFFCQPTGFFSSINVSIDSLNMPWVFLRIVSCVSSFEMEAFFIENGRSVNCGSLLIIVKLVFLWYTF